MIFEIEIGGLLTLEEISLLKTVYENPDPVLLARNLKSYTIEKPKLVKITVLKYTYFDEKMNIKVGASCVPLIRVLNSTSFD